MTRFPFLKSLLTGAQVPAAERQTENPAGGTAGRAPNHGQIIEEKNTTMETALLARANGADISAARSPPKVVASTTQGREEAQLAEWLRRGRVEVFSVVALVTPALAAALLERNPDNRHLNVTAPNTGATAYANMLRRGEWRLNGEPIIVSTDGHLNDGQHRLHAIIMSGVPAQTVITFGIERETRHTVDRGMGRTPGHILSMRGEKNANQLATALQFLWALDEEQSFNGRPSTDQLIATLESHPDIRTAIGDTRKLVDEYRLSAGYTAGAHYLCRKHNAYAAGQWLDGLTTGLNIQNINSPVSRLRKMLGEHSAKRAPKDRVEQAALYIKGYNLMRRGRTGVFSWRANGPTPEAFPVAGA